MFFLSPKESHPKHNNSKSALLVTFTCFQIYKLPPQLSPRQDAGGIQQTASFNHVTWNRNPKQRHWEILRFKDKQWQPETMKDPKDKFFLCDPSSTKENKETAMSILETWLVQGWKQWSVGMRSCTQRQDSFSLRNGQWHQLFGSSRCIAANQAFPLKSFPNPCKLICIVSTNILTIGQVSKAT